MPSTKAVSPIVTAPAKKAAAKKVAAKKTAIKKIAVKKLPPAKQPMAEKAPSKPVPKVSEDKAAKPRKIKQKLVRDSFTMPLEDWSLIQAIKDRALNFKRPAKKSELLRAGLHALTQLSDAQLKALLEKLPSLKLGRPKGD